MVGSTHRGLEPVAERVERRHLHLVREGRVRHVCLRPHTPTLGQGNSGAHRCRREKKDALSELTEVFLSSTAAEAAPHLVSPRLDHSEPDPWVQYPDPLPPTNNALPLSDNYPSTLLSVRP